MKPAETVPDYDYPWRPERRRAAVRRHSGPAWERSWERHVARLADHETGSLIAAADPTDPEVMDLVRHGGAR